MQQQNEYKTMYIKFPTVTKLQYPAQLSNEHTQSLRATQSFRQNFMKKSQLKLDLIKAAESFKIVQLPQRNQIMNICTMTVMNKERITSPNSSDKEQKGFKKKVFSVTKINTFSTKPETQNAPSANPFKIRSSSIKELRKLSLPPAINFDYFDVYPQVARLIALSFGVSVVNEGVQKLRRGKVEASNNGLLVRHAIKKRIWWALVSEEQKANSKKEEQEGKVNFIWSPQILPRRQLQRAIQNNETCIRKVYISEQDRPFQRSFDKILAQLPKVRQLFFTQWEETPTRLKDWLSKLNSRQQQVANMFPQDLILCNHLPNHWQITNKKLLYRNMVDYYKYLNVDPHTRLPKTHHITCFNWQAVVKDLKSQEKVWILKPGEFTNRGNGISIFRNTKEALQNIIRNPPKGEERTYLLQQYISPMLYEERKFDIRCYMLGVQVGKCLKFYWYEQGYIRTASEKFTIRKVCKGIHLTNDAVQKHLPSYDKYESANKLSYHQLDKYCLNNTTFNFYQEILPEMKKMARDICHAVGDRRLIGVGKGISYQIFGLDFLIDETGKPWLCEVNTNPSLQICSSLLSRIIPELIQNTFRLVVDIFLPPAKKTPEYAQSFLTNNKYSLIYSNSSTSEE